VCSQHLYLLKLLRAKGLQAAQLHHVCLAILFPGYYRLMPCQLGGGVIRRINKSDKWLFKAAVQIWVHGYIISFQLLRRNADATLFKRFSIVIIVSAICCHQLRVSLCS